MLYGIKIVNIIYKIAEGKFINMNSNYKVKQITSLYKSCNQCGLPIINCICTSYPKIETEAKLWILSTEKEFYRPSNTARLLKLVNPASTEIFLWERTKNPEALLKNFQNGIYDKYLLFPVDAEKTISRRVEFKKSGKIPAFIIIDGTWKEAQNIFRKSDYLRNLPLLSLEPNYVSSYDLRNGAAEGNLCTIETGIEVLKLNGEIKNLEIVKDLYDLFLKSYRAGKSGHKVK